MSELASIKLGRVWGLEVAVLVIRSKLPALRRLVNISYQQLCVSRGGQQWEWLVRYQVAPSDEAGSRLGLPEEEVREVWQVWRRKGLHIEWRRFDSVQSLKEPSPVYVAGRHPLRLG